MFCFYLYSIIKEKFTPRRRFRAEKGRVSKMEKTKFTKSLAIKTMLRLIIIVLAVSVAAAAVIGTVTYINLGTELREYTFEAAVELARSYVKEGNSASSAAKMAAGETGFKKGDIYKQLM